MHDCKANWLVCKPFRDASKALRRGRRLPSEAHKVFEGSRKLLRIVVQALWRGRMLTRVAAKAQSFGLALPRLARKIIRFNRKPFRLAIEGLWLDRELAQLAVKVFWLARKRF